MSDTNSPILEQPAPSPTQTPSPIEPTGVSHGLANHDSEPEPEAPPPRSDWWVVALVLIYGSLCGVLYFVLVGNSGGTPPNPSTMKNPPQVVAKQGKLFGQPDGSAATPTPAPASNVTSNAAAPATNGSNSGTSASANSDTNSAPSAPSATNSAAPTNSDSATNAGPEANSDATLGVPPRPAGNLEPETRGDVTYQPVSYELLGGYTYELPDWSDPDVASGKKKLPDQIPEAIHALNGKKVVLRGFMVPVDLERNRTTQFILFGNQLSCCYGKIPRFNDWVLVKVANGKSFPAVMDNLIAIYGTMSVGEEYDQGVVSSIYRMDAEEMTYVKDW